MLDSITVRREGDKVLLLSGGLLIAEMPWQAADDLARALTAKARQAEEHVKAERIAFDSAILMRAGVPFSLSNRRDILKEAMKEAAWSTKLRRYMPGGVKSREVFGIPSIINHPPKGAGK
jgi:hypothetical protein